MYLGLHLERNHQKVGGTSHVSSIWTFPLVLYINLITHNVIRFSFFKPYSSNDLLENEEKLLSQKIYVSCMIIHKEYTVKRFSEVLNLHHHYSTFPLIDI